MQAPGGKAMHDEGELPSFGGTFALAAASGSGVRVKSRLAR